jgi:hypothetical protein
MGKGWLAFDSYEKNHVYRARWTESGMPPAHSGHAVCPRLLVRRGWLPLTHMSGHMCTVPGGQTVTCLRLIWDKPSVQDNWCKKGCWPMTHMSGHMCTEPGGQSVTCLRLIWDELSVQDHCWAEGGPTFARMGYPGVHCPVDRR